MEEQLISYEVAKRAKEKGFNSAQPKGYYNHGGTELVLWCDSENHNNQKDFLAYAPTQSLLQKALRDKHDLIVCVYANASGYCWEIHKSPKYGGSSVADSNTTGPNLSGCWDTYEEALDAGLLNALNLS